MVTRSQGGDWFRVLRTEQAAQENRDVVPYGSPVRLQHDSGLFLGVVDAESQPPLSYDQPNDERQHQVCLLPGTYQPSWKADRLSWCFSIAGKHGERPVTFFPARKPTSFSQARQPN